MNVSFAIIIFFILNYNKSMLTPLKLNGLLLDTSSEIKTTLSLTFLNTQDKVHLHFVRKRSFNRSVRNRYFSFHFFPVRIKVFDIFIVSSRTN